MGSDWRHMRLNPIVMQTQTGLYPWVSLVKPRSLSDHLRLLLMTYIQGEILPSFSVAAHIQPFHSTPSIWSSIPSIALHFPLHIFLISFAGNNENPLTCMHKNF